MATWLARETVTLTRGSAKVKGAGTKWLTGRPMVYPGYALIDDAGVWYEIASVGSDKVLELAVEYAGGSGSSTVNIIPVSRAGMEATINRLFQALAEGGAGQAVQLAGPAGQPVQPASRAGQAIHAVSGAPGSGVGEDSDFAIDPAGPVFYSRRDGVWSDGIAIGATIIAAPENGPGGDGVKEFSGEQGVKLAGIEHRADVTDAQNVAAAGALMKSVLTTRGDIVVRGARGPIRIGVGKSRQILTIDETLPGGLGWADPPASAANVVNARATAAEIEAAYNSRVAVVSEVEAKAGTARTPRRWTPQRIAQAAIAALGRGGGSGGGAIVAVKTVDLSTDSYSENEDWATITHTLADARNELKIEIIGQGSISHSSSRDRSTDITLRVDTTNSVFFIPGVGGRSGDRFHINEQAIYAPGDTRSHTYKARAINASRGGISIRFSSTGQSPTPKMILTEYTPS